MFGSIRKKQLNATTAIAMLALVFGMTGGAWAAKKYLITSTKQISPSVLKALKVPGKNGANGTPGAAGPPGPGGPAGPQGGAGSEGKQGAEGKQGPQGVPGEKGPKGTTGSPWAAGGTLPVGATETGSWAFGPIAATSVTGGVLSVPAASFAIKLAGALEEEKVHYVAVGETAPSGCTGGTAVEPKADSGNLCIYAAKEQEALSASNFIDNPATGAPGAGTTGATLHFLIEGTAGEAVGTWAVTG